MSNPFHGFWSSMSEDIVAERGSEGAVRAGRVIGLVIVVISAFALLAWVGVLLDLREDIRRVPPAWWPVYVAGVAAWAVVWVVERLWP